MNKKLHMVILEEDAKYFGFDNVEDYLSEHYSLSIDSDEKELIKTSLSVIEQVFYEHKK